MKCKTIFRLSQWVHKSIYLGGTIKHSLHTYTKWNEAHNSHQPDVPLDTYGDIGGELGADARCSC